MNLRERVLYHQIHPAKLATDWITGLVATWLLWNHQFAVAMIVGLVPAVLVSAYLIRFHELENYRRSAFGLYVARYMTRAVEAARLIGMVIAWIGAWYHLLVPMCFGFAMIVFAWIKGKLFRDSGTRN